MRTAGFVAALLVVAVAGCGGDDPTPQEVPVTEQTDPAGTAIDPDATAEPGDPADADPGPADDPTTGAASASEDAAQAGSDDPADPGDAATGQVEDGGPEVVEDAADGVVEGDGFTITFPTTPTVETVEVPLDEGLTTEATIYQAQVGSAFLGFSYADTPEQAEVTEFDAERALRDSAQGAADNTGGEVAEAEITTVLDRPAIDYLVTVPGGVLRGIAFFDGTRLYTGQLVAEGSEVDRAPLDAMMGSLVLG